MKKCPRCHKTYDDSWNVCLQCNTSLEDALEGRLQNLEEQAKLILKEIGAIRRGDAAPVLNSAPPDEKKVVKVQVSAIAAALAEDTEVRIGKYWLNKIGIISMVAGVAFFVSYAFKYLSPVWRIGVGYAIGAAMIFAGRLMDKAEKYKWYGRSVIAGGWVLAYFTTYAMYHIKATRILSSQPIDLLLLSAVMIVMVMHLFKYRVEGLVGLVMMLGFITAGISQYASFAFIYLAILAAAAGILLVKMKWQALGAFSLLGTYATHLIWRRSYDLTKSGLEEFWISIGFLVVYWSIYNIVSFFVTVENQKDRNILKGFILANSVLFGLTAFLEIRAYHADWKAIFAACAAGVLVLFGILSQGMKGKEHLKTAYQVAAIAFLTVALRYSIRKEWAYLVWFCEIPVLLFIGYYLKNKLYRIAAWVLSGVTVCAMVTVFESSKERILLLGREMPLTLVLYLTGVACFYLARYVIVYRPWEIETKSNEIELSNGYTILASAALLWVSYYEITPKLVTLSWALSAFFLFVTGFFLKDKFFRYSAIGLIGAALFRGLVIDLAGVNTVYRIAVFICLGLVLMAVSFWYTKMSAVLMDKEVVKGGTAKGLSAVIIPLISFSVLMGANLYPSEYRKEDVLNEKEVTVTANFMARKELSAADIKFLKEREFKSLERMLRSLPVEKDGRNLDVYLRALELGVRSKDLYSRLGGYYNERGEKKKAIEMYEKGIALDPRMSDWNTRFMTQSLAKIYMTEGDYKRAAEFYEKYLASSSYKNVKDLYELAICYERLGKLDKALEKLNEAIRLDRDGKYQGEMNSLRSDIYGKKEMLEAKDTVKPAQVLKT